MKKIIRNFIIKIVILTIILAVIGFATFTVLFENLYFEAFPFLLILFPVVSTIIYIQLLKASKKSLAKFNVVFMLSFMLKLIIYAGFVGIVISAEIGNKNAFVITLLLMYLIYTIFDTKAIIDDSKKLNMHS